LLQIVELLFNGAGEGVIYLEYRGAVTGIILLLSNATKEIIIHRLSPGDERSESKWREGREEDQ
jgi:hypothetical protein